MSKITAINKIIEFQRDLYYRAYYPDSNLSIDEVSEMLDDIEECTFVDGTPFGVKVEE